MSRRGWFVLLGVILLGQAGLALATTCTLPDEPSYAPLSAPGMALAYRFEPPQLTVGTFFQLEVVACALSGAAAIPSLHVDARMPAHGHGMNYQPEVTQPGPGHFRFEGLMLHMPGRWEFTFTAFQGDRTTRVTHAVELEP